MYDTKHYIRAADHALSHYAAQVAAAKVRGCVTTPQLDRAGKHYREAVNMLSRAALRDRAAHRTTITL